MGGESWLRDTRVYIAWQAQEALVCWTVVGLEVMPMHCMFLRTSCYGVGNKHPQVPVVMAWSPVNGAATSDWTVTKHTAGWTIRKWDLVEGIWSWGCDFKGTLSSPILFFSLLPEEAALTSCALHSQNTVLQHGPETIEQQKKKMPGKPHLLQYALPGIFVASMQSRLGH